MSKWASQPSGASSLHQWLQPGRYSDGGTLIWASNAHTIIWMVPSRDDSKSKVEGCCHFGGGTDTVSSVIEVTLPHYPLPMAGKGYSGLRCFLLGGLCPTGTVGGILRVFIQAGLVARGSCGAASRRRVSVCFGIWSLSAAPSRLTVRLSGRLRNEARGSTLHLGYSGCFPLLL